MTNVSRERADRRGLTLSFSIAYDNAARTRFEHPEESTPEFIVPGISRGPSDAAVFLVNQEVVLSHTATAYSIVGRAVDASIPDASVFGRSLQAGICSAAAVIGGYLVHEAGHFRTFYERGVGGGFDDDLLATQGINANLTAAHLLVGHPYEGVMSDIAYLVHKMDPFFYAVGQEYFLFDGGRYFDGEGDLALHRQFRFEQSGRFDEGSITALSFWSLADTVPGIHRILRYATRGERARNPYRPGEYTMKTTGALSPFGVRLGLKGYYFLNGNNRMPSSLSGEVWSSPTRQGGREVPFPVGFELAATRLPLPLRLGHYRLATSARFLFSKQWAAAWRIPGDIPEMDATLLAGGGGLHLQASEDWEFSSEVSYKEEGFIPGDYFNEGLTAIAGIHLFF